MTNFARRRARSVSHKVQRKFAVDCVGFSLVYAKLEMEQSSIRRRTKREIGGIFNLFFARCMQQQQQLREKFNLHIFRFANIDERSAAKANCSSLFLIEWRYQEAIHWLVSWDANVRAQRCDENSMKLRRIQQKNREGKKEAATTATPRRGAKKATK